jgi:hypothetical protein
MKLHSPHRYLLALVGWLATGHALVTLARIPHDNPLWWLLLGLPAALFIGTACLAMLVCVLALYLSAFNN